MSSSPWAKISNPESISLHDIMSKEVVKEVQAVESKKYVKSSSATDKAEKCDKSQKLDKIDDKSAFDQDSDVVIARLLQQQFDEEYERLKHTENTSKRTLQIPLTFNDSHRALQNLDIESESEEEERVEEFHDHKDWEQSETAKREITKHDVTLSNQKSACTLRFSSSPDFYTSGGAEFDVNSINKMPNSLKLHWKQDRAAAEVNLDEYSTLQICKMMKTHMLKRVNHIISIGKEAVVLHADADAAYSNTSLPKECVLKVFTLTESEFTKYEKYIAEDKRFVGRIGNHSLKKNNLWAEKEMCNLLRLQKAGIPCPKVVALKRHILVMSFIGVNCRCAPKLNDAVLTDDEYASAYNQVVKAMKTLYDKAKLIHTDLSEYNILWHNKQCYFIDLSQAVEPSHNSAFYFLTKDCGNIINFFTSKGVPNTPTQEELFIQITGFDFRNKIELEATITSFKVEPHLMPKAS